MPTREQHGDLCITVCAQNADDDLACSKTNVQRDDQPDHAHADGNDLRVGVEQGDKLSGEQVHRKLQKSGGAQRESHAVPDALLYALAVACADVLADKGRCGHADGLAGRADELRRTPRSHLHPARAKRFHSAW